MKRYLLDTNVLLRFLLADNRRLSPRANRLFASASSGECVLLLTEIALAEAVWVLTSHYEAERSVVADRLITLLQADGVECPNASVLIAALKRFATTKADFFDCYLADTSLASGDPVASFDRDLRRFGDVEVWDGS